MKRAVEGKTAGLQGMIKTEEALNIILGSVVARPTEEAALETAPGRIIAGDIRADIDLPAADNSAMDGYALKADDTLGASRSAPKTLEVVEEIRAGYLPSGAVGPGQASRIMTGAAVPAGADAVVMAEDTQKEPGGAAHGLHRVKVFKQIEAGTNIRRRGEDIKDGETVISAGTRLTAARVGILASLGKSSVSVIERPRAAVLATGDEVIDVDEKVTPGKLRSSNTYTLMGQIRECGALHENLGIARDTREELRAKIEEGLDYDCLITSGGVSAGDYDLVTDVLTGMGMQVRFRKVAIRPGKPVVFGILRGIPVFGLPGNPVSSMVSFEIFVRPALLKMMGRGGSGRREADAVLEEDVKKKKGFRYFLRAVTRWEGGRYVTRTTGPQGSGILRSMARADSLIILPEEVEIVKAGACVKVRFL